MKRTRQIRLVLIGSLAAGAVTGCGRPGGSTLVTVDNVYTNDHYVPRLGYYHAPFRAWYPERLNHFDPATRLYYQGGQWLATPHASFTNLSSPTEEAARLARLAQPTHRRGGFGGTSGHRSSFLS